MDEQKKRNMPKKSVTSDFRQMIVWQKAHDLTLRIYEVTKVFPDNERFGLVSQLRRAAYSVPMNIAEGFGMRKSKDKARFYNIAQGSLEETKYGIILADDLGYFNNAQQLGETAEEVGRLLGSLVRAMSKRED